MDAASSMEGDGMWLLDMSDGFPSDSLEARHLHKTPKSSLPGITRSILKKAMLPLDYQCNWVDILQNAEPHVMYCFESDNFWCRLLPSICQLRLHV